jgi:hypothetical protein
VDRDCGQVGKYIQPCPKLGDVVISSEDTQDDNDGSGSGYDSDVMVIEDDKNEDD